MAVLRILSLLACSAAAAFAARPASAQFYLEPPKLRGAVVDGSEPGMIAQTLPGATPAELKAALVWNLRAALNVAALQCQFAPMLLTLQNYNALLGDHAAELKASYDVLTKYFIRTAKTAKAGQTALDQYGTRVYSSFSTVAAQRIFCQTAGEISNAAVFTPRGSFGTLAQERMSEMRAALVPLGEQRFNRNFVTPAPVRLPRLDNQCWKKNMWVTKKCGVQVWG
jgi:hypothetical protein